MFFRTAVCLTAVVCLPLTVGCTGIPAVYAYPKISYFPATDLNANGAEVEAFLIKTTIAWHQPMVNCPPNDPRQEVTRLPVSADSRTVLHTSVTVEAFAGTLGPLCYGSGLEHHSEIALYRPGYELVVNRPWERRKTINWKPAVSIAAQERAVDELASAVRFSSSQRGEDFFVADEYTRLARMSEDEDKKRLLKKASDFRKRPERKTAQNDSSSPELLETIPAANRQVEHSAVAEAVDQ